MALNYRDSFAWTTPLSLLRLLIMWRGLLLISVIGTVIYVAILTRPKAVAPAHTPKVAQKDNAPEPSQASPMPPAPVKLSKTENVKLKPEEKTAFREGMISQRAIEESIRADEYCKRDGSYKLDQKLFLNEEDRRLRILKSLGEVSPRTKAFEEVLNALLSRQRDSVLRFLSNCASEECLFLKGLVLTNQIDVKGESRDPDEDLRKGLTLLKKLRFMNRDNGIYPYFILWPQQKLGEKFNLKLTFKDFLRAPKFQNPLIGAYVALAEAGQFNATARLYADEFSSVIGVPEYGKAASVITELIKDKEFDSELNPWAKRRLADLDFIKEKNLFAPAVLIVELAQLKSLARIFWERAGTGPAPQIFGPEGFQEFMKLRSEVEFEGSHLKEDSRTKSRCFAIWDLKREVQTRYATALSEMIVRWENPFD